MAFYYVKNGGTATGDAGRYATQQTGSFASLGAANYYGSIVEAIAATTNPVSGDFILVSDLHSFSTSSNVVYAGVTPTPYYIVSIDDANVDQGRTSGNRGEENATGGGADITLNNSFVSGMSLITEDNIVSTGGTGSTVYDCGLTFTGNGDQLFVGVDGSSLSLIESNLIFLFGGNINLQNGCTISMVGGSVVNGAVTINLFNLGFFNGGGTVDFQGVDLTGVEGALIANIGNNESTDDAIDVRFDMCKLATGVAFTNETFKSYNQRALFTRCSDSSAAAEYQYHLHAFGGDVNDDSAIYRDEDEPFTESNQKISYEIVTNSDASAGRPLWLDFPILRYSELSVGATDTLRFYLASNESLTNKDIYIEISYPDGTNKQTPNFLSSAPTTVGGTLDLIAVGTTLTVDLDSTWTGGLSNNYQIDLNTSVDVGSDCLPIVKVYITKPSVTIQLASEFGLI